MLSFRVCGVVVVFVRLWFWLLFLCCLNVCVVWDVLCDVAWCLCLFAFACVVCVCVFV